MGNLELEQRKGIQEALSKSFMLLNSHIFSIRRTEDDRLLNAYEVIKDAAVCFDRTMMGIEDS